METTAQILAPFRSSTHVVAEARAREFRRFDGFLAFRRAFEDAFKQPKGEAK